MAESLTVEVVTPEKMLYSGTAAMVEAPGAAGDFGVLPQHMPLTALLREGVVKVQETSGNVVEFPVGGGLAQVTAEKCVILAEGVATA